MLTGESPEEFKKREDRLFEQLDNQNHVVNKEEHSDSLSIAKDTPSNDIKYFKNYMEENKTH